MIQSGTLVDLEMLHVAKKDPVASVSEGKAVLSMPRVDPPISVTAFS